MEAWAQHFVELWQANRVHIAQGILEGIRRNPYLPVKEYSLDDIHQIFDGTLAMMTERLSGQGNDIWDTYMMSVIPGILAQGQPLSALVGQITMNAIVTHQLLVPMANDEYRDKISEFITNWYVHVNSETVKIGLESGCKI